MKFNRLIFQKFDSFIYFFDLESAQSNQNKKVNSRCDSDTYDQAKHTAKEIRKSDVLKGIYWNARDDDRKERLEYTCKDVRAQFCDDQKSRYA